MDLSSYSPCESMGMANMWKDNRGMEGQNSHIPIYCYQKDNLDECKGPTQLNREIYTLPNPSIPLTGEFYLIMPGDLVYVIVIFGVLLGSLILIIIIIFMCKRRKNSQKVVRKYSSDYNPRYGDTYYDYLDLQDVKNLKYTDLE